MMNFRIARDFSNLPDKEVRKIQLRLGIILRRTDDPRSLEKVIIRALERMGKPHEIIFKSGEDCENAFIKIISHFGSIRKGLLTEKEQEILSEHPYIVSPDNERYIIYGEAMELIMTDPAIKKGKFLISHIHNLPLNEKKAWARWLKKGDSIEKTSRSLTGEIYREIAKYRMANPDQTGPLKKNIPQYLDEIFPPDPSSGSTGWFFRGVLPFYRCLQLAEEDAGGNPELIPYVMLFKLGVLAIYPESPEFGKPLRWRIFSTLESIPMEKRIFDRRNEKENPEELPFPR